MAENIPLPDSPSTVCLENESTTHITLDSTILHSLLSFIAGENTLLHLYRTIHDLSKNPNTTLCDQTQLLLNSLTERHDQLERLKVCDITSNPVNSTDQLKPDQPPPPDPPDKEEEDQQQATEALKAELETTQSKLKQEEEKRAKSISLLRAVRQKLVQTEKDKNALESELNEMNSSSSAKIKELQNEKRTLEDDMSRLRISQEQQLSKLRHSYERENQSIRTQFERETMSKKSQYELDTITAKAAYERELSNRNQKIAQAEGRLRDVSLERDGLFEQLQKCQAELEETLAQHDELKGSVDELQHQLNDSQNRIHVLCEQLNHLQKLHSTQDSNDTGMQSVIQELEHQHMSKIKALELRINQVEKERAEVESELGDNLRERLAQIESLRAESRLKNLEYAESLESMAKRNQEILKSDAERDALKSQLHAALLACDSQTDLIADLKRQLEELQTQQKMQTEELTRLTAELEKSTEREQELRQENKTIRENEIKKVEEVKGLFLRGNMEQRQRKEGVGYFATLGKRVPSSSSKTGVPGSPTTPTTTSARTRTTPTRRRRRRVTDEGGEDGQGAESGPSSCSDGDGEPADGRGSSRPAWAAPPAPPLASSQTSSSSPVDTLSSTPVNGTASAVGHHLGADVDDAELNFEYLRNTLLQFLEHKEMRPHLVRVLGVILHFTPQEIRRLAAKV